MAAKCNITKLALQALAEISWGFSCVDNLEKILENYIEYLACPTVEQTICYPDDCINPIRTVQCNINIVKLSFVLSVDNSDMKLFVDTGDLTGEIAPLSYSWIYDVTKFNVIGNTTSKELKLLVKPTSLYQNLATTFTLNITDINGCVAQKSYIYTGTPVNPPECVTPLGLTVQPIIK